jgi:hypothetical protein
MSENVSELLALVERLREEIRHLRATLDDQHVRMDAAPVADLDNPEHTLHLMRISLDTQIRRAGELENRILELEATLATLRGSMAPPHPADDEPGNYTHDVPPNAPR